MSDVGSTAHQIQLTLPAQTKPSMLDHSAADSGHRIMHDAARLIPVCNTAPPGSMNTPIADMFTDACMRCVCMCAYACVTVE